MKKVMIAFDGFHFSDSAFRFASALNEKNQILLTGVFLPQISYANIWTYADGMGTPLFVPALEKSETETIEKNIHHFEELCVRNQIEFRVRRDFNDLALPELKRESRFADLTLIGSHYFYTNMGAGDPNTYLRDALHDVECPAIVVPEKFAIPNSNILAYDGSASSVFAIKQFIYTLPELSENKTLLVYISKDEEPQIPDEPFIEELLARHFKDLTVTKLNIDAKNYFSTWMADKKTSILVCGSYGRSSFSNIVKKSFVAEVIKDHQLPVFVAHR
jgi:hypothetical protein